MIIGFLVSYGPFAQAGDFSQFSAWMDKIVDPSIGTTITLDGSTEEGIPCQLYVTRRMDNEFYLSLGVGPQLKDVMSSENHYFGGFVHPQSKLQVSPDKIRMDYTGGYTEGNVGHESVTLDVEVDINSSGVPVRASGQSTLQPKRQVCLLGEPLIS